MRKTQKKELSPEAVLIVLAVASLAAFFYNKTLNIQAEHNRLAFDERRFEVSQKCGEAGRNFFRDYQSQNTVATSTHQYLWLDPEFHFNSRLNTCLVYAGYADEITVIAIVSSPSVRDAVAQSLSGVAIRKLNSM